MVVKYTIKKIKKKGGSNTNPTSDDKTYVPSVKEQETNQVNKITTEALKFINMNGLINSINPKIDNLFI